MEVITRYCCEFCGTPYKEKKDALDCEKGHKKIKLVKEARYNSIKTSPQGYPITLDIQFTDGSVKRYHL